MHNSIDTSVKVCLDTFVSNDFDCSFMVLLLTSNSTHLGLSFFGLVTEIKLTNITILEIYMFLKE